MLTAEHPDSEGVYMDLVLAWHEDVNLGKGTKHMVELAIRAGIPVERHHAAR